MLRDASLTTDVALERLALEALARLVGAEVVDGLPAALAGGRAGGPVR